MPLTNLYFSTHFTNRYFKLAIDCGDPTTNLSIFKFFSACGSPPSLISFNSIFQVRCQSGYQFSDFSSISTLTCRSDGIWNVVVPCLGILGFSVYS